MPFEQQPFLQNKKKILHICNIWSQILVEEIAFKSYSSAEQLTSINLKK